MNLNFLLPCILKKSYLYTKDPDLVFALFLPYFSGIHPDRSWVFLRQSQTGGVGRHPVPLLSALSPPQSLCWSPLSPVKALPCVQLHLCGARHQVPPRSCSVVVWWFSVTESLSFNLLFQVITASQTWLHSQAAVWLCGLWQCGCVAVLHSSDLGFDRSFADRGILSPYNERYVKFHYRSLLPQSLQLNLSCYIRKRLKFAAVFTLHLTLFTSMKLYSCISRRHFSGSELGVCSVVQPAKHLHLCRSGIRWCPLSNQHRPQREMAPHSGIKRTEFRQCILCIFPFDREVSATEM